MESLRVLTVVVLSLVLGDARSEWAEGEIQPVDAILYIDGAPTYLRLVNSTSLENIFTCVLDTSKAVGSVVRAANLRGLQMNVGQVEEDASDMIRRLAAKEGHSLWKNEEEVNLFNSRLARYLSTNYYQQKAIRDSDEDGIYKPGNGNWRRSTGGRHQVIPAAFRRAFPSWGDEFFSNSEAVDTDQRLSKAQASKKANRSSDTTLTSFGLSPSTSPTLAATRRSMAEEAPISKSNSSDFEATTPGIVQDSTGVVPRDESRFIWEVQKNGTIDWIGSGAASVNGSQVFSGRGDLSESFETEEGTKRKKVRGARSGKRKSTAAGRKKRRKLSSEEEEAEAGNASTSEA